jgi:thioredoxin-dependent peroxiredoxin
VTVEREGAFDFFGPRTLIGPELQVGDSAPDFTLLNGKLQPVTRASYAGKPVLLSVVPSLDTGVCSKQTTRFNQEAAAMGEKAAFVTVSADLPFAQARWCGANDAENIVALSDHRDMNFGTAYGTFLADFRLESRAVFVLDAEGTVRHVEYVPAAGKEPDYDAAMAVMRELV